MNGVAQDQHQPQPHPRYSFGPQRAQDADWLGLITLLPSPCKLLSIHYRGLANLSHMTGLGLGI